MTRERWGTFSVADHLRSRAFVAEVLLYDRLVVPSPPTAEERTRWEGKEWKPDSLDAKLKIIPKEMVLRAPWNEVAQERYQSRVSAAKDLAFAGIDRPGS